MALIVSVVLMVMIGSDLSPKSLLFGLLVFIVTVTVAKRLTRKDARIFQVALSLWKQKPFYDPHKRSF